MKLVYQAYCPGCQRRIHAPSEDARRRHMVRHARNCGALRQMAVEAPLEALPVDSIEQAE